MGIVGPPEGAVPKAVWRVVVFLVTMFLIGLAEKPSSGGHRPDPAGTLRFQPRRHLEGGGDLGPDVRAGHAINILESSPTGVLIQMCITASLGILYAAIYYRTGNLWVVVFLHAYQDAAALINSGLYDGTQGIAEAVSSYDFTMLYAVALYLIPTVILLRKSRCPRWPSSRRWSRSSPHPSPRAKSEPNQKEPAPAGPKGCGGRFCLCMGAYW